jgi:hypothetical protein
MTPRRLVPLPDRRRWRAVVGGSIDVRLADAVTTRLVTPWLFGGIEPRGAVLVVEPHRSRVGATLRRSYPHVDLVVRLHGLMMAAPARSSVAAVGSGIVHNTAHTPAIADADAAFDRVVSIFALGDDEHWHSALAEMARLLSPGGQLVGCGWQSVRRGGRAASRRDELSVAVRALGFDRVRASSRMPGLFRFSARMPPTGRSGRGTSADVAFIGRSLRGSRLRTPGGSEPNR